jgi:tRNA pseudouridine55 synthase
MKRRPRGRDISGILLLDKPAGVTSNAALQTAKQLFRARKAGHTGSLDPLATGLLPICFGEATKLSTFLLEADKYYRATLRLGLRTTTGDSEGEVIARRPVPRVSREEVERVLTDFRGARDQIPPMFSAVKLNGVPLYRLAHQGIEVERKARRISIFRLELLSVDDDCLEIDVHCSKGTYVRVLADDLGERLGCGAHICALRRTGVGAFDARHMVSFARLESRAMEEGDAGLDACLLSMESALAQWPGVRLPHDMAYFLTRGQAVFVPHAPSHGLVRIYTREDRFLGVGRILDDGRVAPKRLINY